MSDATATPSPADAAATSNGKGFVHLHLHTHYSLLDGFTRPRDLVKRVKELGMNAVAVTDHGNMHAACEFYRAAKAEGIKPILGFEAYVAPGDRTDRTRDAGAFGEASHHLVLLAENNTGYHNLLKLTSEAYRTGFYYKPRIDKPLLKAHSEGVIALTGHLGTEVATYLDHDDLDGAIRAAREMASLLPEGNLYLELQDAGDPLQQKIIEGIVKVSEATGLPLVADNDAHFLLPEDHAAHDILLCIATGKKQADENRMRYSPELYVKSPSQMRELFKKYPEACDNTLKIADRCNVDIDFGSTHAPVFDIPASATNSDGSPMDDAQFLRKLCVDGIHWRYGFSPDKPEATAGTTTPEGEAITAKMVFERLDRELDVIVGKGFASYFLIVDDFVRWARGEGIPAGARGSGVGTMVGYSLGLSHVCPLTYGLLFERFMDPNRAEYPDIDIDLCQDNREKVIEYVRRKYHHVCQIVTFMTLGAKAAIKDVCRVLDLPINLGNTLANQIPSVPKMTLAKALKENADLKACYDGKPPASMTSKLPPDVDLRETRRVIDLAMKIEGLARNPGIHAAGVIVCDHPIDDHVPLMVMERKEGGEKVRTTVTQYDGPTDEACGLLKMDFLGLKTLSVVELAVRLIKQTTGDDIDLDNLDLTDQKVFEVFRRGQTQGFFQFESGGMQDALMKMKPDRIEDLIAAAALYRPGPMELIPDYCARKHGQRWTDPHPVVEKVCRPTYGIMVYQEQVMQIVNQLGGIELGTAYKLIKAISKKKQDQIDAMKPLFIAGAQTNGLTGEKANELFDLILKFAGYGFNKSHSAGYAVIAYQTAYLKTYYPAQFMAATLTYESRNGKVEELAPYIDEARKMGLAVLPPDVNSSFDEFTVVEADERARRWARKQGRNARKADEHRFAIRFGLRAIKGVGHGAVQEIIAQRAKEGNFEDIYDFVERVDPHKVNSGCFESLIKAGAFDTLGVSRGVLHANRERIQSIGADAAADRRSGQASMFDMFDAAAPKSNPRDALIGEEWSEHDMLQHEKEVLSLYVTNHPLTQHTEALQRYATVEIPRLEELEDGTVVTIGGLVTRLKETMTKKSQRKMAIVGIEDLAGYVEATIFPDTWAECFNLVDLDRVLFLRGEVDRQREKPGLRVSEVVPIARADELLCERVVIDVISHALPADKLPAVKKVLEANKLIASAVGTGGSNGSSRRRRREQRVPGAAVVLAIETGAGTVYMNCPFRVNASPALSDGLTELLGEGACTFIGGRRPRFQQAIAPSPAPAMAG